MDLDLIRRGEKGFPLDAVDYDGNLDKLEAAISLGSGSVEGVLEAINDLEASLKGAAFLDVGTVAGTVASGNDPRFSSLASNTTGIISRLNNISHSNCIYVAKNGNDSNTGAIDNPLLTAGAAALKAMPGDVVFFSPGTYTEPVLPIRWKYDVTVFGSGLRSTVIRGAQGQEFKDIFHVDSGFWCWGISFAGHQADNTFQSWAISFDSLANNTARGAVGPGAFILKSPYIQNCTSITAEDDAGLAGSQSTGNTGGGIKVDGHACAINSPIRSMVVDSYTQVNLGGPGCLVLNDGYAQLVSFFGTFCEYHVRCESGGQTNLSGGGTSDFGNYGLVADGYSPKPLYTGSARINTYGAARLERSVTINTSTDQFFCTQHELVVGDQVRFSVSNGDFPTGLAGNITYYVISLDLTPDSFRVSSSDGNPITMVGDPTGSYTFIRQGSTEVDVIDFSPNRLGRQIKYPSAGSLGSPGRPVPIIDVTGSSFTVILDPSTIIHEYVGGGTAVILGNSYPVTSASYDNVTGNTVLTVTGYTPIEGVDVVLTGLSFICSSASRPNAGQLMFPQLVFPRNSITGDPMEKTFIYSRQSDYVLTYEESPSDEGPDHEYVDGGTAFINNIDYGVSNAIYNKGNGIVTLYTKEILPLFGGEVKVNGLNFICPTSAYVVTSSVPIDSSGALVPVDAPTRAGYRVNFYSDTNGGLKNPISATQKLDFRNRSQVSAPSHTFEYVGSGLNYDALPWNGGVPNPANAIIETNNGRVYSSNTNEKGDFKVGKQFEVDGTTGSVTISTDEFNLSGLNFIGPFSRNGGISTVGEQLREISNNSNLIASTGGPDGNTVPTQSAVKNYVDNLFLQDVTVTSGLPLTVTDSSTVNSQGYWTRRRNISLSLNTPNGLVRLDDNGRVPSGLLPSFVDDVLEYANLAAIQAVTGETGKIYVALDSNKTYRWSGSAYIEISKSPGTTDEITDFGAVNKYFSDTLARAAVGAQAGTPLTYNQSTGIFTFSYGTTGTPQFAGIGVGVAPASGWGLTIGQSVCQRLRTISAVSNIYTIDVLTGNEFEFADQVATGVTVNLSSLDSIPSGYVWRGVFSFKFASGSVNFFPANISALTPYQLKWDGGVAPVLTTNEVETFIVSVNRDKGLIEIAAMRGRI